MTAICPWCDEPVGPDAIQYGAERLHPACHEELGEEMDHVEQLNKVNQKVSNQEIANAMRRTPR